MTSCYQQEGQVNVISLLQCSTSFNAERALCCCCSKALIFWSRRPLSRRRRRISSNTSSSSALDEKELTITTSNIKPILTDIILPAIPEIVAEGPEAGEREKGTEAQGTEQAEQKRVTNPE